MHPGQHSMNSGQMCSASGLWPVLGWGESGDSIYLNLRGWCLSANSNAFCACWLQYVHSKPKSGTRAVSMGEGQLPSAQTGTYHRSLNNNWQVIDKPGDIVEGDAHRHLASKTTSSLCERLTALHQAFGEMHTAVQKNGLYMCSATSVPTALIVPGRHPPIRLDWVRKADNMV